MPSLHHLCGVLIAMMASVASVASVAVAQAPPPPDGSTPPPLPTNPNLPVFRAGGGRTLIDLAIEESSLRGLLPPLSAGSLAPAADPKNLEGTWTHDQVMITRIEWDAYGAELPFTSLGRGIRDRRVKSTYESGLPYANASAQCKPPGQPWLLALYYPFQIYQTKHEIVFVFDVYHSVWTIRLDQQHRDASAPREYMGDSVGRWDGNTLVVDTINYKRALWLDVDGTPASKDARMVHRIRKIDYGDPKIEIVTTVHDPKMYSAPWSIVRTFAWRPDRATFGEYNCERQVGASGGVERYGLIPEPEEHQ